MNVPKSPEHVLHGYNILVSLNEPLVKGPLQGVLKLMGILQADIYRTMHNR